MKQFFGNIKKYSGYLRYAPVATLKAEVSTTYLNWLWWFLDPLLFMFIYTFIAKIMFNSKIEYFPLFVFIGLNAWNMFNRSAVAGLNMIRFRKSIVTKVYVPKYILVLEKMMVEGIKIGFSYIILIVMMIVYKVPLTWHIVEVIPMFILLFMVSFSFSCILLHCGVYVSDLNNIIAVALRMMFYMTGIFFDLEHRVIVSKPVIHFLLTELNPMYLVISGMRNAVLYGKSPDWIPVLIWFGCAFGYCCLGVHLINRHEDSYVKIV